MNLALRHRAYFALAISVLLVGASVLRLGISADEIPGTGQRAFPSAEGFGAYSRGGRGGRVIEVTNLLDKVPDARGKLVAAPGSLRAAIEATGPRIVVFRVSGTIDLGRTTLDIKEPYLTIAGQSAPGDGIALKNGWVPIQTHDVIIRHIRIRPGPGGYSAARPNGASANVVDVSLDTTHNIIFDHVSMSWGTDENFSITNNAHNVTVQNSIISEAMHCVPAPFWHDEVEQCHSKNILVYRGATDLTFHHNLMAHAVDRNPLLMSGKIDFVNNVTYNYGGPLYIIPRYTPVLINIVGNVFRAGANSLPGRAEKHEIRMHSNCSDNGTTCYGSESRVYLHNNIGTDTPTGPFREARPICPDNGICIAARNSRFTFPSVTTQSAHEAYTSVLATAGATLPNRDAVDARIVTDVRNGTGQVINTPDEVGGWPVLATGVAPTDTDHDGMPDSWEKKHGLKLTLAADATHDGTGDGYTNIEKYLNELAGDSDYGSVIFQTIKPDLDPSPLPSVPLPIGGTPTPKPTPTPTPTATTSAVPTSATPEAEATTGTDTAFANNTESSSSPTPEPGTFQSLIATLFPNRTINPDTPDRVQPVSFVPPTSRWTYFGVAALFFALGFTLLAVWIWLRHKEAKEA